MPAPYEAGDRGPGHGELAEGAWLALEVDHAESARLDGILALYVERDSSVEQIVAEGHDRVTVERVVGMVDAAEYKRRQGPMGVKITTKAFGKDRRVPVTNGFRR